MSILSPISLKENIYPVEIRTRSHKSLPDSLLTPNLLGVGWLDIVINGLAFARQLINARSDNEGQGNRC